MFALLSKDLRYFINHSNRTIQNRKRILDEFFFSSNQSEKWNFFFLMWCTSTFRHWIVVKGNETRMGCGISSAANQPNGEPSTIAVRRRSMHKQLLATFSYGRNTGSPSIGREVQSNGSNNRKLLKSVQKGLVLPTVRLSTADSSQSILSNVAVQCCGGLLWISMTGDESLNDRQKHRLYELQYEAVQCRCVATQSDFAPFDQLTERIAIAVHQISRGWTAMADWQDDDSAEDLATSPLQPKSSEFNERCILSDSNRKTKNNLLLLPIAGIGGSRRGSIRSLRRLSTQSPSTTTTNDVQLTLMLPSSTDTASGVHAAVTTVRRKHVHTQAKLVVQCVATQTTLSIAHMKTSELLVRLTKMIESPSRHPSTFDVDQSNSNENRWTQLHWQTRRLQQINWKRKRRRAQWIRSEPGSLSTIDPSFDKSFCLKRVASQSIDFSDVTSPAHFTLSATTPPITLNQTKLFESSAISRSPVKLSASLPLQCDSSALPISSPLSSSSSVASIVTVQLISGHSSKDNLPNGSKQIDANTSDPLMSTLTTSPSDKSTTTSCFHTTEIESMRPIALPPKWTLHSRTVPCSPSRLVGRLRNRNVSRIPSSRRSRPHSADSSARSVDSDDSTSRVMLAISNDTIGRPTNANSADQQLLQQYLKSVLLKVHSDQSEQRRGKSVICE